MTATPKILSISPTRIEEKNKEKETDIFEAIEETHQPLLLDSGATEHVYFERRGPTKHRSQGNTITIANGNEIAIREFKNKFTNLLSSGTFQQVQPADLLTRQVINHGRQSQIYAKTTSQVQSKPRTKANQTGIITGGNRFQTVDISNRFLHLLVRVKQQRRAIYSPILCHTHGQQGNNDGYQCRNENFRCRSGKYYHLEETTIG